MAAVPITVPERRRIDHRGHPLALAQGRRLGRSRPASRCFELETDKASNVVPAPGSGVLKIGVAEGETVAIGATVGTIDPSAPAAAAAPARPTPRRRRQPPERPGPRPAEPAPRRRPAARDRPLSPSVRRLVAEENVDVARIDGTGPRRPDHQGGRARSLDAPTGGDRPRRPRPAAAAAAPAAPLRPRRRPAPAAPRGAAGPAGRARPASG